MQERLEFELYSQRLDLAFLEALECEQVPDHTVQVRDFLSCRSSFFNLIELSCLVSVVYRDPKAKLRNQSSEANMQRLKLPRHLVRLYHHLVLPYHKLSPIITLIAAKTACSGKVLFQLLKVIFIHMQSPKQPRGTNTGTRPRSEEPSRRTDWTCQSDFISQLDFLHVSIM